MPDVTFLVSDLAGAEEAEKLELALTRLEFVKLVNVDSEKGLVAVSYDGGEDGARADRGRHRGGGVCGRAFAGRRPGRGLTRARTLHPGG